MIIVVKKLPFKINLLDLFRFFHKICACKSYIAPVKYSLSILKKPSADGLQLFLTIIGSSPQNLLWSPFISRSPGA